MKKYILIDLDDTLLDFQKAEQGALNKTMEKNGITLTPNLQAQYSAINDSQWKLLEQGLLTREQVKLRRFQLFFEFCGIDASADEAARTYEYLLENECHFIPGALSVVQVLYQTYDLYMVTNGTAHVQHSRLDQSGLIPYFKGIFISEEVGFDKPSKEYFDYCFSKISDFDPANAVIVGDSLTSDIQGGINMGLTTVWYNRFHKQNHTSIQPDHEFDEITALPALLQTL